MTGLDMKLDEAIERKRIYEVKVKAYELMTERDVDPNEVEKLFATIPYDDDCTIVNPLYAKIYMTVLNAEVRSSDNVVKWIKKMTTLGANYTEQRNLCDVAYPMIVEIHKLMLTNKPTPIELDLISRRQQEFDALTAIA